MGREFGVELEQGGRSKGEADESPVLRRDLAALLGAGLAAACTSSTGHDDGEALGVIAQSLTGDVVALADTVLGVAPPAARTGDLATKNSANMGNATIVIAKSCVAIDDGGGGVFYWDSSSTSGDDGGTIIVPSAGGGRWVRVFSGPVNVKWFGAQGVTQGVTGPTPYTEAIQAAISACATAGGVVAFPPGRYRIASTLTVPSNVTLAGAGMGLTTIYMAAASFTNRTSGNYDEKSVGISCSGQTAFPFDPTVKVTLRDFTIESEIGDERHLYPILVRNSRQLQILRVEAFGIPAGNLITLDSVGIGEIAHCFLHDCSSSSANSVQLTGIETDGNRVGPEMSPVNCVAVEIHHNTIVSLTFTGAAFPGGQNMQTDGINTGAGSKHSFNIHDNHIQNVGEGVDCFSSESTIHGNMLVDCNNVGVKIIHGASCNHVYGNTIIRPGLAGLLMGGSAGDHGTDNNYFHDNLIHDVNPINVWASNTPSGIYLDGDMPLPPSDNTFRDNKITGGAANMHFAILQQRGNNNRFYDNEAESWKTKYSAVLGGTAQITSAKKTLVRAHVGSDQVTTAAVGEATVNYDTEETDSQSEFDTSTKVYTSTSHRRLRVFAVARFPLAVLGDVFQLKIRKNGVDRTMSKEIVPITNEFTLRVSDTFAVVPGDTVEIRLAQVNGNRTITGNSLLSYLTIEEVSS